MKVKTHPKSTNLNRAVTLELSLSEAIRLEAFLGHTVGATARLVPWYDDIANALEKDFLPATISAAVEAQGIPRFPAEFGRLPLEIDNQTRNAVDRLEAQGPIPRRLV